MKPEFELTNGSLSFGQVAAEGQQAPKIVKTTTKQTMVQNADGVQHNKEEKTEDLTPGGTGNVTVVSSTNKVSASRYSLVHYSLCLVHSRFWYCCVSFNVNSLIN